jgi:hypothetical protein
MESCRWNLPEKLGISHAPSRKDGYHIYRVPPTILWSFSLRMQFVIWPHDTSFAERTPVVATSLCPGS